MEQQMQPRLHLKGPAQGIDGRFPLTSDNIEWHMRMLPPMKESKYERILRYVHDQQQHVPAAVDPAHQQQDIDASVLMTGNPVHHDYQEPQYGLLKPFHSTLHPLSHNGAHSAAYGPAAGMAVLAPPRPGAHQVRPLADRGYPQNAQQANHTTTHHADAAAVNQGADDMPTDAAADNEEDDNTPLAAINMPALRPRSLDVTGMEKYMPASLDDPLPGPGSPAYGARMSMMSFHSTMAVNLNSEANDGLSRSLSASNPMSAAEQVVSEAQAASQ
ncbi:hypothetical protein IWW50_006977, partial [Coemansia erecta]